MTTQPTIPTPEPEQRPAVTRIFVTDNGLRAGWRFFLYAISVVLLTWLFASLIRLAHPPRQSVATPGLMIVGELALLFAAYIPALVAMRLERRPWGNYGLPLRTRAFKHFFPGLLVGFAALSLLLLLMHLWHGFYLGSIQLHAGTLARYAFSWAVGFLLVALTEEFLFRGYSQYTLATGMGFWPAAVLLSLIFGAVHLSNLGEAWTGAVAAALVALVFAFSLWRTGSLWFAVGAHMAWDWAESFFYGVPDSGTLSAGTLFHPRFAGSKWITGGKVGPEGSIFVLVAIALIALCVQVLYPKRSLQL